MLLRVKKSAIFILLVFYIAVQLKPLTVFVKDAVAHTFFNARHIATVHFENGSYHIHKELKVLNYEDLGTPQKAASSQRINELISTEIELESLITFVTPEILVPALFHNQLDLSTGHSRITIPPPKTA